MNLREFINKTIKKIVLEDSSNILGSKLTPDEKNNADIVLNTIKNQLPGYEKYRWPDESYISYNQWGYILESLLELAKESNDKKYGTIFSNIFYLSPIKVFKSDGSQKNSNSPLFNTIIKNNGLLKQYFLQDENKFNEAIENAWEKIFYTDYWFNFLSKYKSTSGGNFGKFTSGYIQGITMDYLKSSAKKISKQNQYLNKDNSNVGLFQKYKIYKDKNPFSGDHYLKILQFRKALEVIFNSAKTLPLTKIQNNALQALREVAINFKSYQEIADEFPELLSNKDGEYASHQAVVSRLKNKALINSANQILKPKNLDYNIFLNPNWQSVYNLPIDIIDQILKNFDALSKYTPSDKRKIVNDFTLFTKYGFTPEEIFKKSYEDYDKKTMGHKLANIIHSNLFTNDNFLILADRTLKKFGFTINFEDIPWGEYIKIGKEFKAAENNKQQIKQYAENFISEVKRTINQ